MDYRKEAKHLTSIGISVVPVCKDGGKKPAILWKEYQERIMTDKEIERYFKDCGGVIAVTGNVSKLLCVDFDLDKELPGNDFWKKFNLGIPSKLKRKMRINRTRSGGFHIWARTTYEDKSRKIAHRLLTMEELFRRHKNIVSNGASDESATKILLRKPLECVIETRSRGSYGVIVHPEYTKFYGESIGRFSEEEIVYLIEKAYSLIVLSSSSVNLLNNTERLDLPISLLTPLSSMFSAFISKERSKNIYSPASGFISRFNIFVRTLYSVSDLPCPDNPENKTTSPGRSPPI